jgi:hypothetical protein
VQGAGIWLIAKIPGVLMKLEYYVTEVSGRASFDANSGRVWEEPIASRQEILDHDVARWQIMSEPRKPYSFRIVGLR